MVLGEIFERFCEESPVTVMVRATLENVLSPERLDAAGLAAAAGRAVSAHRWFPGLRRLAGPNRARLVARLDGHPRAVESANDLVENGLRRWEDRHGE